MANADAVQPKNGVSAMGGRTEAWKRKKLHSQRVALGHKNVSLFE